MDKMNWLSIGKYGRVRIENGKPTALVILRDSRDPAIPSSLVLKEECIQILIDCGWDVKLHSCLIGDNAYYYLISLDN